ncbi:MAG: hypothetical protein LBD92_00035 [Oscillospiraceae bacterium]|nr:hypothetical protein [Oscillospiraceae bacterium]
MVITMNNITKRSFRGRAVALLVMLTALLSIVSSAPAPVSADSFVSEPTESALNVIGRLTFTSEEPQCNDGLSEILQSDLGDLEESALAQGRIISVVPVSDLAQSIQEIVEISDNDTRYAVIETITDEETLMSIAADESINESEAGELVAREIISILPADAFQNITQSGNPEPQPGPASPTIENVTLLGHAWYYSDQYTPYQIYGPSTFSNTVSKTGSSSWNYSGSLGIKSVVEAKVGYTIGVSRTVSSTHTVQIPAGQYVMIKVFNFYTKHSFDLYQGSYTGTYETWYPNSGLRITNDFYSA